MKATRDPSCSLESQPSVGRRIVLEVTSYVRPDRDQQGAAGAPERRSEATTSMLGAERRERRPCRERRAGGG